MLLACLQASHAGNLPAKEAKQPMPALHRLVSQDGH